MVHRDLSPDDPRLDPYRHVADPAWLRARAIFVAEGRLVVARLIALQRYDILSVAVNQAAHDALAGPLSALDRDVYVCGDRTLSGMAGVDFHRGCLALVRRPGPIPPDSLNDAARLVALEGVGNPDNVGGLFRTAAALGAGGILLDRTSGDPFYRKAIRTSMGATLRLPFARLDDWLADLQAFRARGFRIVALTPDPDALPLDTYVHDEHACPPMILLLGSEGAGLQPGTLTRADARVRIPIDPSMDSLHVVVAAGIALDRLRQRP